MATDALRFIAAAYRGRWFMLFASFLIMAGAGGTYVFAVYSKDIKSTLGYDQKTLNTLGFFKDLGANAGIISGLFNELVPGSWIILAMAAAMNFVGYFMIWLAITGRTRGTKLWQMCLYIFVGANSQGFANTGCLVPAVYNFPESRGIILGLLKGFVGLSGGVFTQLYHAIYGDDSKSIVLLIAWIPAAIAIFSLPTIRIIKLVRQPGEFKVFLQFLYVSVALAVYLLVVIIIQKTSSFSRNAYVASAVIIVCILFSPLFIVFHQERKLWKQGETQTQNPTTVSVVIDEPTEPAPVALLKQGETQTQNPTTVSVVVDEPTKPAPARKWWQGVFSPPARGEDYTILQAVCSVDMIMIFVATAIGTGSSLAAVDNMGQIGESLGYNKLSIGTFVSLISIWNYAGRVTAGFVSEMLIHKYKCPRPLIMAAVLFLACVGHVLVAFPGPGSIYVATIILGFTFGAQMPLFLAMISELFGLKHYTTLFNVGVLSSPVGSYVFNIQVAGRLYDKEADRQLAKMLTPPPAGKGNLCIGVLCYRLAFIIITVSVAFAGMIMLMLTWRTKAFYGSDIYAKYKGSAAAAPPEKEKVVAGGEADKSATG